MPSTLSTTSAQLAAVRLKSANKHIFRALVSLASAALLTRVMGMLTQIVVTSRFGAGAAMDAYFVASTFPTTLAYLLISTVETAVIPVYARIRAQSGREQASILFSTLINLLALALIVLVLVLCLFREQVLHFSAPALDVGRAGPAQTWRIVFWSLAAVCSIFVVALYGIPYAADRLAPVSGQMPRIFTSDQWGDYLTYRFYPRIRIFVDGRSDLFGPTLGKEYVQAAGGHYEWEQVLNRYGIEIALVPIDWPLAELLKRNAGWRLLKDDGFAILFERRTPVLMETEVSAESTGSTPRSLYP